MEKFNYKKRDAQAAAENFFVVTEHVSPLQRQLLDQKILLSNMPADVTNQAELDREMQVLYILEYLVEAEKQQHPHYAVSRLVAAIAAPENILNLTGKIESEHDGNAQLSKLMVLARHLSRIFDIDTPFADLLEERTGKAAEAGEFAAQWWYLKQILKSIPPMLIRFGRNSVKSLPLSIYEGSGGDIVKTTIVNVLATLIAASLLGLIWHIIR